MHKKAWLGAALFAPLMLVWGWMNSEVRGDADAPGRAAAQNLPPNAQILEPIDLELEPEQIELMRRLDQPVMASFRKTPLQEALTSLGKQTGVHFILDADAMAQEEIDADAPVSGRFEHTPLYRAVERLLSEHRLELCLSGEAVLITDSATAKEQVWTRSYPVVDLAVAPTDKRPRFLGQELVELLHETIEPESWDDLDGPGFATFEALNFSLVVTQSLKTHKSIERFLSLMRRTRGRLDEFCRSKSVPPKQQLWSAYFSPPLELRRMYETMVMLEDGASPGIVGLTASHPTDRLVPAAARRLAAKALAFAQEVEEDLEADALDKDGGKEPILAKVQPPSVESQRFAQRRKLERLAAVPRDRPVRRVARPPLREDAEFYRFMMGARR